MLPPLLGVVPRESLQLFVQVFGSCRGWHVIAEGALAAAILRDAAQSLEFGRDVDSDVRLPLMDELFDIEFGKHVTVGRTERTTGGNGSLERQVGWFRRVLTAERRDLPV